LTRLLAFVVAVVGLTPPVSGDTPVAFVVTRRVHEALRSELNTFAADAATTHRVRPVWLVGDWSGPETLRSDLKRAHANERIEGAVFVGPVPMHAFDMHGGPKPNPLYFEDFDLVFQDRNGDGIDDHYTGAPQLKLWTAQLRAVPGRTDPGLSELRTYLTKAAAHVRRPRPIDTPALAVTHRDWPDGAAQFARDYGTRLVGSTNLVQLGPADATVPAFEHLAATRHHGFRYLQVHSTESRQDFEGGPLNASTLRQWTGGAVVFVNHGCSTADWFLTERERHPHNTAQSWVFGRGSTLALLGNVRSGMVYQQNVLYQALLDGKPLGTAYRAAKQAAEDEMHHAYPDGTVISGIVLLGTPFLDQRDLRRPRR
jgi:hypothetical protein